ncbi:hypothetical protein PM10SUCC1_29180 [Propionigenium maris DSM 9537]|uniref:Outer membrane lipoprotein-sorting protein n=1 Tax=Propionigenium maris DSM 9537 TaxID=1123000 RepID=A0A9W6GP25_9FUSO|nr:hypothetical protein [Propionigenium maris]GLI57404.1 hypothetical protein PM10SUCC1_29180 [Propionigenium maris DSM 9537]
MNFKSFLYLMAIFLIFGSTSKADDAVKVELVDRSVKELRRGGSIETEEYLIKNEVGNREEERYYFKVESLKREKVMEKKVFVKGEVFNNATGEKETGIPTWRKIYQIKMVNDTEGRIKKVFEKSYVMSLEGREVIMYVPIKTIKKRHRYYDSVGKSGERESAEEVDIEKFYRKIFYGSGEKSSVKTEALLKEIVPESTLMEYNTLDLGDLKEVVENEDEEEFFLKGTIKL